jgi:hypothetical protein
MQFIVEARNIHEVMSKITGFVRNAISTYMNYHSPSQYARNTEKLHI